MIIAVDGPAASGKGTLARRLAAHYDLAYLDTGALYRAVALAVLRAGGDPADQAAAVKAARALDLAAVDDAALRRDEVAKAASVVAVMEPVRAAIRGLQRDFAHNPPGGKRGAVLDGRDIGTVICPEADVKLYVDARPEVRAHRRALELRERLGAGKAPAESEILADLLERDARDRNRAASPLRPAPDALLLDTSNLSIEAAFEAARERIDRSLAARPQEGGREGGADTP